MTKHRYSEQQLKDVVTRSRSIRQVLIELNISSQGGNYRTIKRAIEKYNINTSHFTNQGWAKNVTRGPRVSLSDYLSNKAPITSHALRIRLLREKIFDHECSNCKLSLWLDNPIPLELDHIDGCHTNNLLHNLRLLCPNCHSLTSTYRGRKLRKHS